MAVLVVDASVALKWILPEQGSDSALELVQGGHRLLAPSLLLVEASNVLWLNWRRGHLSHSDAEEALVLIRAGLTIEPDDTVLAPRALSLAAMLDHPVYDCLYLALAERHAARLVSADRRLGAAVARTPPLAGLFLPLDDLTVSGLQPDGDG